MSQQSHQKGQILLEAILMGTSFMGLLLGFFFLVLLLWNTAWSRHHLYETLICLNSLETSYSCRQYFHRKSQQGLVAFKVQELTWNPSKTHIEAQLVSIFHTTHKVQREIQRQAL